MADSLPLVMEFKTKQHRFGLFEVGGDVLKFEYVDTYRLLFSYEEPNTQNIKVEAKYRPTQQYSFTYTKPGGKLMKYQDTKGNYWDESMGCPNPFGDAQDLLMDTVNLTSIGPYDIPEVVANKSTRDAIRIPITHSGGLARLPRTPENLYKE